MKAAVLLLALVACQSSDVSRTLGARCDVSSECAQKCIAPSGGWPGGFCTTTCDTDDDCGPGARCLDEQGGVCAFACVSDPDCVFLGAGYTCQQVDDHGTKAMACHG